MRDKRLLTSIILVLVLVYCFVPVKDVYAANSITNVKIDSAGMMTWDAYPGAAEYKIINLSYGSEDVSGTEFNLKSWFVGKGASTGNHTIQIVALNQFSTEISERKSINYTYTSKGKLATPTITKWDGKIIEWTSVENASDYRLSIWDETINALVVQEWVKDTSKDLTYKEYMDTHKYHCQVYARDGYYGYENSASAYADSYGWYNGIPIAFTKQPVGGVGKGSYNITWGLNEEPDSIYLELKWGQSWIAKDDLSGGSPYTVEYNEYQATDGKTTYRIKAKRGSTTVYSNEFTINWNATITFDAGGGSGAMASVTKPISSNWIVSGCSFTSSDPDKEFDCWKTSDGKTVKPGDTIVVTNDLKLTAQWKWKEGTPLLKEMHYYIPEPEPGEMPSNNIKLTTVPENAFSADFVETVEKMGASNWRKSSDNSTFVEMESGETFKQGMYYRNEISTPAGTGLLLYLIMGKLFNTSVVKGMAPDFTTYVNDIKTATSSDIVFLCRMSIDSADVKSIEDQKYTGSEITPEIEVSIDGTKLVKDTDYTVTYSANKEPGTATVNISGSGIYKGTKTITFKIVKDELTPTPSPTKDPSDITPDPTVSPTPVPTSGKFAQDDISPENPVKVEDIEKTILNIKDEKDTKGSTFTLLKAKGVPKSKKSIKLSWSKVPGAEKYMIFGNKCGKKNKYKYITTVTGTSYTAKKLKKGIYYKYTIVAVKGDEAIATSKTIHVVSDGGKKGNNTKVKLSKTKLSLKAGKSKTIKAKLSSKKKVSNHRKVAWESDNLSVAKVNSKGKITAVGKGTCYVYAYAQNGVAAKIKITVK